MISTRSPQTPTTAADGAGAPAPAGEVAVTFTLDHPDLGEGRFAVVGDFNGWDPHATPMQEHDGHRTATVALAPGRYRFRYLREDGHWFNDPDAHDYQDNAHGGHDSVLDLAVPSSPDPDRLDATLAAAQISAQPPGTPGVSEPADPGAGSDPQAAGPLEAPQIPNQAPGVPASAEPRGGAETSPAGRVRKR